MILYHFVTAVPTRAVVGYFLLMLVALALLRFALRRRRARTRRVALAAILLPAGALIGALLPGLFVLPAMVLSSDGLACAAWSRAIAWNDVAVLRGQEETIFRQLGRGLGLDRRQLAGVLLTLDDRALTEPPLPPALGWLPRQLARLDEWHLEGGFAPAPGARLTCGLADVDGDAAAALRLMQALVRANRADFSPGSDRSGLLWCEESGHFTEACVAGAKAAHAACLASTDYDACRREAL